MTRGHVPSHAGTEHWTPGLVDRLTVHRAGGIMVIMENVSLVITDNHFSVNTGLHCVRISQQVDLDYCMH